MGGEAMANFTEKAIKESFVKLLNEKPLSKITVKDIVEDCGINRNSFYYHYRDIPDLLEKIVAEITSAAIERYPSINSLGECLSASMSFVLENRRAVFHIYNSVSRDMFEKALMKLCGYVVGRYVDTAFEKKNVSDRDKALFVRCLKCELFGLIIDWLNEGMKDDAIKDLERIAELGRGLSDLIFEEV